VIQSWTVSASNPKTGPIATSYVGSSLMETRASCLGCGLLDDGTGLTTCYAWTGQVRRGANMVFTGGKDKSLGSAFMRAPDKRAVRMGAIGDPGRVERHSMAKDVEFLRKRRVSILAYTHHWASKAPGDPQDERAGLASLLDPKGLFMASCESLEQAEQALDTGWCPTLVVPQGSKKIRTINPKARFLLCPAMQKPGVVTCAQCQMCDPNRLRQSRYQGIMFEFHGSAAPRKRLPVAFPAGGP
jgi:hypothetical protein